MPAPILDTKRALERHLGTLVPAVPIAYEGVSFTPPDNQMYLHTQFVIQQPDDPTIGDMYYRERISFQVFVCDVLNKGTATALAKAEAIRSHFDKGSFFLESGTRIHVLTTPKIDNAVTTEDRLVVPVVIDVIAEVNT